MPIPQLASLLASTPELWVISQKFPAWLDGLKSDAEFHEIRGLLKGVPFDWLDWAEAEVRHQEARGREIISPLRYRLSVLQNGVVNLQEAKFLLDTLEQGIRAGVADHSRCGHVLLEQVLHSIPEYERIPWEQRSLEDFIPASTFHQICELCARNWSTIPSPNPNSRAIAGYRMIFSNGPHCRDVNRFRCAMRKLRQFRNDVAHGRKPLTFEDLSTILRLASDWLKGMRIDVRARVSRYRVQRPKFLEEAFSLL